MSDKIENKDKTSNNKENDPNQKTILIMAGGTGGHIFPGLAVADILKSRGWNVVWVGRGDGMEAKLVPARGYEMAWLDFSALRGKGLGAKLALPKELLSGFWQSWKILRKYKPNVVLGMGGYISFPAGFLSAKLGIPLVINEQNSVAGLANRKLAPIAKKVTTGFPDVFAYDKVLQKQQGSSSDSKVIYIGNAVRQDILKKFTSLDACYASHGRHLQILVIGGSLGAAVFNEVIPKGIALIPPENRPEIVHQAGEKHLETLKDHYAKAGVNAHCVAFIDDMAGAYDWADLVICRAGALTIAELTAMGKASWLVPYPHAVDDHQTHNAKMLVKANAARLIPQNEFTEEVVAQVQQLNRIKDLYPMSANARKIFEALPNSAEELAKICEEVAK